MPAIHLLLFYKSKQYCRIGMIVPILQTRTFIDDSGSPEIKAWILFAWKRPRSIPCREPPINFLWVILLLSYQILPVFSFLGSKTARSSENFILSEVLFPFCNYSFPVDRLLCVFPVMTIYMPSFVHCSNPELGKMGSIVPCFWKE